MGNFIMKKQMRDLILLCLFILPLGACGMFETYEEPRFNVIKKDNAIELRSYEPFLQAEVTVSAPERDDAANEGFRALAGYIFFFFAPKEKMAMTVPVIQKKIQNGWTVHFVMPLSRTLQDLPKPDNAKVTLVQQPAKKMIAITFSGTSSKENLGKHEAALRSYVTQQKIKIKGEPVYAFYNSPFSLPFMRRNEIMFETVN